MRQSDYRYTWSRLFRFGYRSGTGPLGEPYR